MSGLEVLARMRREGQKAIPVLLLSARSEVQDRIHGLDVGADDYLAKPFDFGELVARIRALVRRGPATRAPRIEIGGIVVDTSARAVSVNGQILELTRSEYIVLEALFMHRGVVMTKDTLLDRLHDSDSFASRNVIEVFVSGLRKKLRSAGAPDIIATRRGHGYLVPALGSYSCPDDVV